MTKEPRWLVEARYWVRQRGYKINGVQIIFDQLDDYCWASQWEEFDQVITLFDPERDATPLLTCALTVVSNTRDNLKNRDAFYDACYPRLRHMKPTCILESMRR